MKLLGSVIFTVVLFCSFASASYASDTLGTAKWDITDIYIKGDYVTNLVCDVEIGHKYFSFSGAVWCEKGDFVALGSGFLFTQTDGAFIQLHFGIYTAYLLLNSNLTGTIIVYDMTTGSKVGTGTATYKGIN